MKCDRQCKEKEDCAGAAEKYTPKQKLPQPLTMNGGDPVNLLHLKGDGLCGEFCGRVSYIVYKLSLLRTS